MLPAMTPSTPDTAPRSAVRARRAGRAERAASRDIEIHLGGPRYQPRNAQDCRRLARLVRQHGLSDARLPQGVRDWHLSIALAAEARADSLDAIAGTGSVQFTLLDAVLPAADGGRSGRHQDDEPRLLGVAPLQTRETCRTLLAAPCAPNRCGASAAA